MGLFRDKFLNSISRRFVILILLVSSVVTLAITAIQLYWDYRVDLGRIEERLVQIERSNLESLSDAVWVSNKGAILLQLEGILKLPDMQYLEVLEGTEPIVSVGEIKNQNVIKRVFPLQYTYNDKPLDLGSFHVVITLEGVYQRLFNKVLVILGTQSVKTFIVSLFIILIFYFLVARHLEALSRHAKDIRQKGKEEEFTLARNRMSRADDELDMLVKSFNSMTKSLKEQEEALQHSHDRLEARVEERTVDLRQANENLQRTEGHLRALVDTVFDGVISTDKKGIIKSFSPAAERIFQYSRDEVIGRKVEMLMPEPYHSEHDGYIHAYMSTGVRKVMGGKREVQGKRKDKTTFPLDLALGESTVGGEPLFIATIRDISRRKQHAQALSDAKEQAEAANKAKSDFLSSMSHELRTPLNGIIGFAQLLEFNREEPLSESQKEYVDHILNSGRHLLDLINEILDLARIESGRVELEYTSVDPLDIFAECIDLVGPMAAERNIRIVDRAPDDREEPFSVLADYTRVKQILINLASNAIKYNRPGGEIRFGCCPLGQGFLRISVSDTGTGIPPEKLTDLFQPFNRAGADKSKIEGTGIGLTITRNLVEMMGGRIGVESTQGVGSTFWFDLPLATDFSAPAKVGNL